MPDDKSTEFNPLVSVVVPVHNREDSIEWALGSVLSQTYQNIEVVVVDDFSEDSTVDRVLGVGDARVRLVKSNRNLGPAGARNLGIESASGEFIAFQDSDDFWMPNKIADQLRTFSSLSPDYIGVYSGKLQYGSGAVGKFGPTQCRFVPEAHVHPDSDLIYDSTRRANHVTVQSLLVKKSVLEKNNFDGKLRCNEDWELILRLSKLGKIGFTPSLHCIGTQSTNSVSGNARRHVHSMLYILRKHQQSFSEVPHISSTHFYGVSRSLSRLGQFRFANTVLWRAIASYPFSVKSYVAYFLNLLRTIRIEK